MRRCPRNRHGGWKVQDGEVFPVGDLRAHRLGRKDCPCRPFYREGILVHRAFDRRELSEPDYQPPPEEGK